MEQKTQTESSGSIWRKWKPVVVEYTQSILLALILALVIRTFVVQAYEIPSGSMENTLLVGDHILVNKFIFGTRVPFVEHPVLELRDPERGDVIVFAFPEDRSKDFIKRVIGVPGDQIRIVDKHVYVNGKLYEDPHEVHKIVGVTPGVMSPRDNMDTLTVPASSYFVMGDNRDNSYDSRFWGFVKRKDIRGLAFIKYWSWNGEDHTVRWRSIGNPID